MKRYIFLICITSFIAAFARASDVDQGNIAGKWVYTGLQEEQEIVECPDLIHLRKDGAYVVLNDCYGFNPIEPITEEGKWSYDEDNRKLTLKERRFKSNYHFITQDNLLVVPVENISSDELILKTSKSGKTFYEKYRKLK